MMHAYFFFRALLSSKELSLLVYFFGASNWHSHDDDALLRMAKKNNIEGV
jgi:hypothetical protein